jgi:hypothetical protein
MKTAKELCTCIGRERRAQAGQRRPRFSAELKRAVSEYVLDARSRGVPESQLKSDLGIGPASLIRWCGRRSKPNAFRQVAMVRSAGATLDESSSPRSRVAIGRSNATVAIIGLTASELVELCRSLGC